ncbi:MAG: phosphoribosylformylglycinamidine synthase [Proteobacteria bacterium]|nr:MAG: phosphoribosylformylglycinamidine synthase [Pseudomonadota bacterium]
MVLPTGFGVNCERETAAAFTHAGAQVDALHLNDLIADPDRLRRARILALCGGFSFGDHLGAGRVLANRLRHKLRDALDAFVADGGLVLGICNGFQTMVCLGLLPSGRPGPQQLSLRENRHGSFYDGWVTLGADAESPCVFTRGIERLEVPVRHGEGRLAAPPELVEQLEREHLVPLRYLDPETGLPTERFPHDPNGSALQAAGVCDPSGRIFGLMPHPEAFLHPENHPNWRRRRLASGHRGDGEGLQIFVNAVESARG